MQDLKQRDPEIPYVKTERAIHDLICSILERQDRMNEAILCRVIDIEYRIDNLETYREYSETGNESGTEEMNG